MTNREALSFQNCTFQNCRSTNEGGIMHLEMDMLVSHDIEFYLCEFHSCIAYRGGGFVYLLLHDISQIHFSMRRDDKDYVLRPNRTDKGEVVWWDTHPYCYLGQCEIEHSPYPPYSTLLEPGVYNPIPKMQTHFGVPSGVTPHELFGEQWLVDLMVDVAFPFARWEFSLDGLIDNPYADEYRIGFRYLRTDTNTQVEHTIDRFRAYSHTLIEKPNTKVYTYLYVGDATQPSLALDCSESGSTQPLPTGCCNTPNAACPTLETVTGRIDSDVFLVVILPNATIKANACFIYAVTVAPYTVTTQHPKGELFFSYTANDATVGRITVEKSGMAYFYDCSFVLKDVHELLEPNTFFVSGGGGLDMLPSLFYIHYFLCLDSCEFTNLGNVDMMSAALAAEAVAGDVYRFKLKVYKSLIEAYNAKMKFRRTCFTNITVNHTDGQLIHITQGDLSFLQGKSNYGFEVRRCSFIGIEAQGNGSCVYISMGENRGVLFSECTFVNVKSHQHGGALYIIGATLDNIFFPGQGMGFTIRDNANGGYVCPGKPTSCHLISASDTYLGKTLVIVLRRAVPTIPFTGGVMLGGLNNFYLQWDKSHISGFILPAGAPPSTALVPRDFTLEDVLGKQKPPVFPCEVVSAMDDPLLCLSVVASTSLSSPPTCYIDESNSTLPPQCRDVRYRDPDGKNGAVVLVPPTFLHLLCPAQEHWAVVVSAWLVCAAAFSMTIAV